MATATQIAAVKAAQIAKREEIKAKFLEIAPQIRDLQLMLNDEIFFGYTPTEYQQIGYGVNQWRNYTDAEYDKLQSQQNSITVPLPSDEPSPPTSPTSPIAE